MSDRQRRTSRNLCCFTTSCRQDEQSLTYIFQTANLIQIRQIDVENTSQEIPWVPPHAVPCADQSWCADADQNGKDQVWDGPVHKDELTQNSLCNFQLLQTILKIIKLTKKSKICFSCNKSYQNSSQFKMCECHGFYLCCTSVLDNLVLPTCPKNSEISSTHCLPQKPENMFLNLDLVKTKQVD